MLTQSQLKDVFDFDGENFFWKKRTSNRIKIGDIAGAEMINGYITISVNGKPYLKHRLVWLWVYGAFPDFGIDHIDGNRKNNKIDNLRQANQSQNMQNMKEQKANKSGVIGVFWRKDIKKWSAYLTIARKRIYFGTFSDKNDAIMARKKAISVHHPYAVKADK